MDFKSIIGAIAPTVATMLGGPLAGLAVDALGTALGMESPTVDKVKKALTTGQLSGDQIVALKTAEQAVLVRMEELGIQREQLEHDDRASARAREVGVKDKTNQRLAFLVVGAFILMVGLTLAGAAKVESVLAGTLVGYLSAKCEQVLAYYFGSTKGSADKTNLLAGMRPPPPPGVL